MEQFLDIIEANINLKRKKSLNDIGSNLGQFWKGLQKRHLNIEYRGYDIEPLYISAAKKIFLELRKCLYLKDITKQRPFKADILVISATLEHFEHLTPGLNNILESTKELLILRTFLGNNSEKAIVKHDGASAYYPINQYSFREVLGLFEKYKFEATIVKDRYTDSLPQYLRKGIVRTQYIIIGKKKDYSK